MPPLFFALASTSSDEAGFTTDRLALLPGAVRSPGWQAAIGCKYPQELVLQLEREAEVQEIEIMVRSRMAPRAIDVHLSCEKNKVTANDLAATSHEPQFELVGTLRFDKALTPRRGRTAMTRRARMKCHTHCTGLVRLLIHEPAVEGAENPHRQVALESVTLWGHEGSTAAVNVAALGLDCGETTQDIAHVLMELGISLDLVPMTDDTLRRHEMDAGTLHLVEELEIHRAKLLNDCRFGEVQQIREHMQHLVELGVCLRRAALERDRYAFSGQLAEAQVCKERLQALEKLRLSIAALYETNFWLEHMAMGFSPDGISSGE